MALPLFLGARRDLRTHAVTDEPALLDPDRLVRHAVCLGMTGSGKTGLCIGLLEELAIAGIPVVAVDPKGDLTNLALAFPEHLPEDFAPWVDPAAAARAGLSVDAFAAQTAAQWRAGLAASGVDAARITAFATRGGVRIYTPGGAAGRGIDVIGGIARPLAGATPEDASWDDQVQGAVSSLLGLVGIEADPVRDPRHLVLARIVDAAWRAGESADLERLVTRLVDPPFAKVGVFPVETFFPRADRLELALAINAVASSPAFAGWSRGEALDLDAWFAPEAGIRVLYLAHLDDAERIFFLTWLLNQVVAWTRRQSGTSALRGLLYIDEIFGYLPPAPRSPPTKRPLLTLLKQARAMGLGVMTVTQNPIDLDYSALSNCGTWFVGRLQTPQDRERALAGLATAGADSAQLAEWVEQLPARTFLLREVSVPEPVLLAARHTISFLRGPLVPAELARLADATPTPQAAPPPGARPADPPLADTTADPPPAPAGFAYRFLSPDVVFSPRLAPWFGAAAEPARQDGVTLWRPALVASLHLHFDEGRDFVAARDEHRLWFPLSDGGLDAPVEPDFAPTDLLASPVGAGRFAPLPAFLDEARELSALSKRTIDDILRSETDQRWVLSAWKLTSRTGESEEAFRARAEEVAQTRVDEAIAKLREKVERELARLEEQHARRLREKGDREREAQGKAVSEVTSVGETVLGFFFGRRSAGTAATRAIRNRQSTLAAQERVARADAEITVLEGKIYDLEQSLESQIAAIEERERAPLATVTAEPVRLDRTGIRLDHFGIVWVPVTRAVG